MSMYLIWKFIDVTFYLINVLGQYERMPKCALKLYVIVFKLLIFLIIMGEYALPSFMQCFYQIKKAEALVVYWSTPMLLTGRIIDYLDAVLSLIAPMTITLILHYFAKDHKAPSSQVQDVSKTYQNFKVSSWNQPVGSLNDDLSDYENNSNKNSKSVLIDPQTPTMFDNRSMKRKSLSPSFEKKGTRSYGQGLNLELGFISLSK